MLFRMLLYLALFNLKLKGDFMKVLQRFQVLIVFVLCSSGANAELVESFTWKAFPGKAAQMLENFAEAKGLHEAMGAQVSIGQRWVGGTQEVDYTIRFDDMTSWAKFWDYPQTSKEMQAFYAFMARTSSDPVGEMVSSIAGSNADLSKKAADFEGQYVYTVNIWDPAPGKSQYLMERFLAGKKIHEKLGARVEIYMEGVGGTGRGHYVMMWESHAQMGETFMKMAQSKEWLAMLAENDPDAFSMVASYRGQTVN